MKEAEDMYLRALTGLVVGKICDGMGWYEASDSHPTVGWYGILLVSSYGTGDLWDIPWDVAKCG